jgi:hypothetical protein
MELFCSFSIAQGFSWFPGQFVVAGPPGKVFVLALFLIEKNLLYSLDDILRFSVNKDRIWRRISLTRQVI